jgi:hypothetical protein
MKIKGNIWSVLAIIFSLMPLSALATEYFVSPTGLDSNNGLSATTPWKTLGHAQSGMRAGDTLNIMEGDYREYLIAIDGIAPTQSTPAKPTIYKGYGDRSKIFVLGSEIVMGWTDAGGGVYKAPFIGNKFSTMNCWEKRTQWLKRASSATGMSQGYFFYDGIYVYVNTYSGNKPDQEIECSVDSRLTVSAASYVRIENITVMHSYAKGVRIGSAVHDFELLNCDIGFNSGSCDDNSAAIFKFSGTVYQPGIKIIGNKIHDQECYSPLVTSAGNIYGLDLYWTYGAIVANNEAYNVYSDGAPLDSKGPNPYITFANNIVHNGYRGIRIYGESIGGRIVGNIVYDVTGRAIQMASDDCSAYNNTIYGVTGGSENPGILINESQASNLSGQNFNIKNNLITYANVNLFFKPAYENNYGVMDSDNNNFFNGTSYLKFIDDELSSSRDYFTTLAKWVNTTPYDQHSLNVDPSFVDLADRDFHLQAGSKLINRGIKIANYHCQNSYETDPTQTGCRHWSRLPASTDADGAPDIGAYEYGLPDSVNNLPDPYIPPTTTTTIASTTTTTIPACTGLDCTTTTTIPASDDPNVVRDSDSSLDYRTLVSGGCGYTEGESSFSSSAVLIIFTLLFIIVAPILCRKV